MDTNRDYIGEQIEADRKQADINGRAKELSRKIGKNMNLIICLMVILLPILKMWVSVGFPVFEPRMLSDALIIMLMFFVGEYSAIEIGKTSGKMDEDHIKYRAEFDDLRKQVYGMGISGMEDYCDFFVKSEFESAIKAMCRRIGLRSFEGVTNPVEIYEKIQGKTKKELVSVFGMKKAAELMALKLIKPIELSPDLILMDGFQKTDRGDIKESGEHYARKNIIGKTHVFMTIFSSVCIFVPQLSNAGSVTFASIATAFLTILAVSWRMSSAYAKGVRAYNVVEVKHLQSRIRHLHGFIEFRRNNQQAQ